MKVFLSWSGVRSKFVADALRGWIPRVLQAAKPWMSDEDISSGARWSAEIASELEETKVGIICLTPENQHNPWVMFEAGALSKTLSETFVCPYLYDLSPSQMSGPTSQFQATISNKDGTLRILQTLNKALGDNNIFPPDLEEIFEVWWPKLEEKLSQVPKLDSIVVPQRSKDEILDDILNNTREQLRREEIRLTMIQESEVKLEKFIDLMEKFSLNYSSIFDNLKNFPKVLNSLKQNLGTDMDIGTSFPETSQMGDMLESLREFAEKSKSNTKMLLKKPDDKEDE